MEDARPFVDPNAQRALPGESSNPFNEQYPLLDTTRDGKDFDGEKLESLSYHTALKSGNSGRNDEKELVKFVNEFIEQGDAS